MAQDWRVLEEMTVRFGAGVGASQAELVKFATRLIVEEALEDEASTMSR